MLIAGTIALSYAAFSLFMSISKDSSPHKRLGASRGNEDTMKETFNGISMLIWGLVVSKAKTGLEAVKSGEEATVGGYIKKVGALIAMIVVASGANIMAN